MDEVKGFEVRLKKNEAGQCLYITNRLRTGAISLIIGEERPSVADVHGTRWDVPEEAFADLWRRVENKVERPATAYTVAEINTIREGMVETPEIIETPEKAVRRPRGRRPRVPKAALHD